MSSISSIIITRTETMKIICVTAAYSKLGKTTLVENLLPLLQGWAACKVTACIPHKDGKCPRGHEDTCGICNSLDQPYIIEEDNSIIDTPDTDTWRYLKAGAAKVFWIKARPEALSEAITKVKERLSSFPGVIFEGNHALLILEPDVSVMILSKNSKFKKSALSVKQKVQIFAEPEHFESTAEKIVLNI